MTSFIRNPDAASGLGRLLRSVPVVVREVLYQANLQRTGCLRCGIGPHHVLQYPHLRREEAGEIDQQAYKRWTVLIGEELMLYGSSSSVETYKEGARARMAARKDLPRRPPRLMRRDPPRISRPEQVNSPIQTLLSSTVPTQKLHLCPSRLRPRKERVRRGLVQKFPRQICRAWPITDNKGLGPMLVHGRPHLQR